MTIDSIEPTTPPRTRPLGPHGLAQRVDCRICAAGTNQPCLDGNGSPRTDPHHSRWTRYQRLVRRRPFIAVVLRDLPPALRPGDVLVCVASDRGGTVDVIGDGTGRRFTTPTTVDASAVDFRAFVDERGGHDRVGRRGRRHGRVNA